MNTSTHIHWQMLQKAGLPMVPQTLERGAITVIVRAAESPDKAFQKIRREVDRIAGSRAVVADLKAMDITKMSSMQFKLELMKLKLATSAPLILFVEKPVPHNAREAMYAAVHKLTDGVGLFWCDETATHRIYPYGFQNTDYPEIIPYAI